MDEPMSALDLGNQADILQLLMSIKSEGKTLLMVSHNPLHALSSNGTVCLLDDRHIFAYGPSNEILSDRNIKQIYGTKISLCPRWVLVNKKYTYSMKIMHKQNCCWHKKLYSLTKTILWGYFMSNFHSNYKDIHKQIATADFTDEQGQILSWPSLWYYHSVIQSD